MEQSSNKSRAFLSKLDDQQLRQILLAEVESDDTDVDLIRNITAVLESRDHAGTEIDTQKAYQFFVEESQINIETKRVFIEGPDVNHIKNVLRMKPGEEVNISNGSDGKEYRCAILDMNDSVVNLELRFIKEDGNELPVDVTLYQGLPKADKMELIIQKCVELGVRRIVPVAMKRCVVKLEEKKASSKISRWQSIAEAAAKQSKRGIIPEIGQVMSFGEALSEAAVK